MTTATLGKSILDRLDGLKEGIKELTEKYRDDMNSLAEKFGVKFSDVEAIGDSGGSDDDDDLPPRRGRPASNGAVKPAKAAAKKAPPKATGKVAPDQRNYSNTMSLKQAVWDVLSRRKDWGTYIDDLTKNPEGLQINQINKIIEQEGNWVSSSENIGTQLGGLLGKLRKDDLIGRGDKGRYYIIPGAELPESNRGRAKK